MISRITKLLLPLTTGLILSFFVAQNPAFAQSPTQLGSITVCKVVIDSSGNVVDGSQVPGVTFSISGINPAQNSAPAPVGTIGTSNFTTPINLNTDLLSSVPGNDVQCQTYGNLALGNYYWGQETINPQAGWSTPKYNDQHLTQIATIADFYTYDNNLFDGNSSNDASRNTNADGHIVLYDQRPHRTLVVLNQYESQGQDPDPSPLPSPSPSNPSQGGNQAPSCPIDNKPQKPDQVWFTNITPGSVTVNWASKGDAQGYHVAYGINPNQWLWGVQVANVNQVTLNNLPQDDNIWVTVIPLGVNNCPGNQSDPTPIPGVGGQVLGASNRPQVLAATGTSKSNILIFAGIIIIALGLWQLKLSLHKPQQ